MSICWIISMFSTLSYPINLESCINWLLFPWNCILWTLRNREYQTFVFPLRPTARFNLIPCTCTCTFYACIPSPCPYRTRWMQFQTIFIAPYKSTWLHFHGLIYVIVVKNLRSINKQLDVCNYVNFPILFELHVSQVLVYYQWILATASIIT